MEAVEHVKVGGDAQTVPGTGRRLPERSVEVAGDQDGACAFHKRPEQGRHQHSGGPSPRGHGRGAGTAHTPEAGRLPLPAAALPPLLEVRGRPMSSLSKAEWLVLNATADDYENLEEIYRATNWEVVSEAPNGISACWREASAPVPLADLADAVRSLVERGFLTVKLDPGESAGARDLQECYVWR